MKRGNDMKKIPLFICVILIALFGFSTILVPSAGAVEQQTGNASLIIKLVDGLSAEEQAAVIARNGGVEVSSIPALRLHIVELPQDKLSEMLIKYKSDPQVQRAEENKKRKVEKYKGNGTPNDHLYLYQWSLQKIGWDNIYSSVVPLGSATVAILDTGVDALHPDLNENIVAGTSIIDGSDGMSDPDGHGTWLAGIVAAKTNNKTGVAGVGFSGVRIMPVTVLGPDGIGQDSDIIAGILHAVEHGANVILMGFSNPDFSEHLHEAIEYAWSQNVVLVAATGNDALTSPTFPAGDRGVIGVSATDSFDTLPPFSNYGEDVFLAAPGTDIVTTDIDDGYTSISGTSASAAIVAGVAAFMKAADPGLTNGVIAGRLARSAEPVATEEETGYGRVNMSRAVADRSVEPVEPPGIPDDNDSKIGPYRKAAICSSLATGNWNAAATWNCGHVPTNADDVTINATHTVTMNSNPGAALSITINGTANWANARTYNIGAGGITINPGGNLTGTVNGVLATTGNFTINAATTSTSVRVQMQTTGGQTINGTGSLGRLIVNSTTTNTGNLTVTTALTGTSTLTNGANATLNIGGTSTITGLTATAAGNTVNYNGAAQTVKATNYNNLTLSGSGAKALPNAAWAVNDLTLLGTATATTRIATTVAGNLNVQSGTTLTVAGFNFTVNGTTTVGGTLAHSSATGTKTYTGAVTINSGGSWTNAGSAAITFNNGLTNNGSFTSGTRAQTFTNGGLTNNGTLTAGTGAYTFTTNAQSIGGNATTIPNVTVTGVTLTNNIVTGGMTASATLSGTGTITQGPNAILTIGGTSLITGLDAGAAGNTVVYNGAAQTVKVPTAGTYTNLTVSGSGTKTLAGALTVNGNLSISVVTLDVSAANYALNVRGNWTNSGAFVPRSGAVTFNGPGAQTISGATTWYGLAITGTAARTVFFQSGVAQTISANGFLTFTGAAGQLLTLAPLTAASPWLLTVNAAGVSQSISYVSASYSNAGGGTKVIASNGTNVNGGNNVNWVFGLDHITLSPSSSSITVGGNQSYTATAYDAYNNILGDVTSSTTFSLSPDGSCTANSCTSTISGAHTVTGSYSGKTSTATLQIVAASYDHIMISPSSATITAGDSQTYTAEAFDQYNNSLGDVTGTTTFSLSPDGSCTANSCSATEVGLHTVTGNNGGKTSTSNLQVNEGVLDHIVISPSSATITAGDSQTYTAEAFDQYDNSLGDVTGTTTFSLSPDGSCTANSCSATAADDYTVTATHSGKTSTAILMVTPGAAVAFIVDAPTSTVAGSPADITVTARDTYNNVATSYTGTLHFTSTDSQAVLPGDYSFQIGDSGSKTFTDGITLKTSGAHQRVTATDTSSSLTGTSQDINVGPSAPSTFLISTPASVTAGTAFTITATVQDAYGNTNTDYTETVNFTSSDTNASVVLPGDYTFTTGAGGDNGVHTFTGETILVTAPNQTVTVGDGSIAVQSGSITVFPAAASAVSFGQQPGNILAGQIMNPAVTVRVVDQYGNSVTGSTASVTMAIGTNPGGGTLGGTTTVAAVNGIATFGDIYVNKTGNGYTLTASATGLAGATSTSFNVSKADTTTSVVSSSSPSVSGQSVTFTATVSVNAPGSGTPSGTVTFYDGATCGAPSSALGTGTLGGGSATFGTSGLGVGSHTITACYEGNNNFNTSNGSVAQIVNKANSITALASSVNPSAYGQAVTFTATVSASAPGSGTPTGTVQFRIDGSNFGTPVTLSGGSATSSSISSLSVGSHTVTADYSGDANFATSTGALSGGQTVNKASQTTTVITPAPASAVYNSSFSVAATASSGLPVAITSSGACSGSGSGSATITMTSATGTCTVHYNQAGDATYNAAPELTDITTATKASQTITVTTPAPANAAYNSTFSVAATASSGLAVTYSSGSPSICTNAGAVFTVTSGTGTCSVQFDQTGDANYNAAPQVTENSNAQKASQTITFDPLPDKNYDDPSFALSATASSGLTVSFSSLTTSVCTVAGTTVTIEGIGTCTIRASQAGDANYSAAPDVDQSFLVNPGQLHHFEVSTISSPQTAGTSFSITVTAQDAGNNTVSSFTGSVDLSTTAGTITPTVSDSFTSGIWTGNITVAGAGTGKTITATKTGGTETGTSNAFDVNAGAAVAFSVSAPSSAIAGTAIDVTVTARDAYNNVATGYTGTVHFTSNDSQAMLPSDYTFQAGDNGIKAFTAGVTLKASGTKTVTATDTLSPSITGISGSISVGAASVTKLSVTAPAVATAGTAFDITVTAQDTFGNTVTGYGGSVQFSSSDSQAVLPANYTFQPVDSGSKTFMVETTLKTAGSQTVTTSDIGTPSITGTSGSIAVSAGTLDHITVSPASATITAGGSQDYTAEAFDQYNNSLGDVTGSTTFSIAPDGSCTADTCTATIAGAHSVTATYSGKTATASLQVNEAGILDHITISPASATIFAGGSQNYTAEAFDQYNNSLGDVTGSTTFSIAPDGFCTADSCSANASGAHTVTASYSGKTATAILTVNAGALDHVTINPASAMIIAGDSQSYTTTAFDAYNNSLGDVTGSTIFSITPDGSCTGPTCTATAAGVHTVTATCSGKTAVAGLQVDVAALDHITISPALATVNMGGKQTYTAQAYDAYNNNLGDVTGSATFAIAPDCSCRGAECTAATDGDHTVTGAYGGKTATATLHVNRCDPDHIVISPSLSTISAGGSQTFTAEAFDAGNNSMGDVTSFTLFTINPEGSCAGASCAATLSGPHTVTANAFGKTSTASIQVNAGTVDRIRISPQTGTVSAGVGQAYTVEAFDAYNNSLGDVTGTTAFSLSPDGSCTLAICSSTVSGPHTVTATNGANTAAASLQVNGGSAPPSQPANQSPVADFSLVQQTGADSWTATLIDRSTDDAALPANSIRINWGDGSPLSFGDQGGAFSHTYIWRGTYTITETVIDAGGAVNNKIVHFTTSNYAVSGRVTLCDRTTPMSSVRIDIMQGSTIRATAYTNTAGNYTFLSVPPGTYTIVPSMTCYNFPVLQVTVGPDQTVNIIPISRNNTYTVTASAGSHGTASCTPATVNYNASSVCTISADTDYVIADVKAGPTGGVLSSVGALGSYTLSGITADMSLAATFASSSYTVTPSAGPHGSITPPTPQSIAYNTTTSFLVAPLAGFFISSISGCGGTPVGTQPLGTPYTYTTGPITSNCTITATFATNTFTVTPSAGPNGSISPATPQSVTTNGFTSFVITPAAGYSISSISGCGGTAVGAQYPGIPYPYTTGSINSDCTVTATFALSSFTVTPAPGTNGTMNPLTPQTVNYNGTTSFVVTPDTGYSISSISGCGGTPVGAQSLGVPYTYTTGAITSNCSVTATFTPSAYTVTPSAGANGSMIPALPVSVNYNATTSFLVTPSPGFSISSISGCGGTPVGVQSLGVPYTYTTGAITSSCTVTAAFQQYPVRRISGSTTTYANTLQSACDSAISGDTIQSQASVFSENLSLNHPVALTLKGGYTSGFTTNPGSTIISGSLTISSGTATVENIVIQ